MLLSTVNIDTSGIKFTLDSAARDVVPLFILSFNITKGPPTVVNCTANGGHIAISGMDREVLQSVHPFIIVQVHVKVMSQISDTYQCTINNTISSVATPTIMIAGKSYM